MGEWTIAMNEKELPEGTMAKAKINGKPLLLIKAEGQVYTVLNECPHLGCTMHRGTLTGYLLTCPCHDWVFDIRNGQFTAAPEIKIPLFPTRVENGEILVDTGGDEK